MPVTTLSAAPAAPTEPPRQATITQAGLLDLDSCMRMMESHGDGKIATSEVRAIMERSVKWSATPAEHAINEELIDKIAQVCNEARCLSSRVIGNLELARRIAHAIAEQAAPKAEPVALTLSSRIAELIERHGSLRAAARVLECDPGYLSRLQSGEKNDPGDPLLRRMGLRQIVTYARSVIDAQGNEVPA
ncbi:hypothetical protein Bpro_3766 [Polaromonas sp. JS666]|nr:hypothetical protein Bpro_3766 [Polaromonas sp. JS666]